MNQYFYSTSKYPRSGYGTFWATAKLSLEGDIDNLLNVTNFDFEEKVPLYERVLRKIAQPNYKQLEKVDAIALVTEKFNI